MKVSEYLRNSGLQATASVTFNDLTEILDGAPPPTDSSAGAPPESAAAGAPTPIAGAAPVAPQGAAAAVAPAANPGAASAAPAPAAGATPAAAPASDVNARMVERFRTEFPDDYARVQGEVAGGAGAPATPAS